MAASTLTTFKKMVPRYLGRPWVARDGISSARIQRAARRLKLRYLPASLRALYSAIGGVEDLCRIQNFILSPEELHYEDGHLMIMEENQSVVSWGIPVRELVRADPIIWQRNNTPPTAWYSERKRLAPLLRSMFDWYAQTEIWRLAAE